MTFQNFLNNNKIYSYSEIENVLKQALKDIPMVCTNTKHKYYNVPCSFDIETSSFIDDDDNKTSIMYVWQFGINGLVIIGRTWNEFIDMINKIIECAGLDINRRLIIYVHNLSYEFQFIRKRFEWYKVFSIDTRKPIYAITNDGIEFRCSYLLSGYSLAKLGDELHTYQIKKLVGDLDYTKIRNYKTSLSDTELNYCVNDVKVVMAFIQEEIEKNGNISKIPLTKTGYVRRYVRNKCFYDKNNPYKRWRYTELMKTLRLTPEEYYQLKRAFQGGFTHCNPFYSGKVVNNVESFDFTSSYPAVMLSEQFPMSSSEKINIKSDEQLEKNLNLYCCLFDLEIFNLESKLYIDSYISRSRCWNVKNAILNNGRVVSADLLSITVTEQDFKIIKSFYTWDKIRIRNFRRYKKGYLPKDFILAILELYQDKTQLKGVPGKEIEYMQAKAMLNSCYGMAVTDIVRDEIVYTDDWNTHPTDVEKSIEKYNNNTSRFMFYPWGVWVTAYARRNLFTGILQCGNDYIYSDTDSIKVRNPEKHMNYIKRYNEIITEKLENTMKHYQLPTNLIRPKTIKGIEKPLGIWDDEGMYLKFKSLGAKRYMVETDAGINITVSGLNKNICVPWMIKKWGNNVFEHFNDSLYVPSGFTGKNIHTYIDSERRGEIVDYLGNTARYDELSAVHLMPGDYSLSISREYAEYIAGFTYEN